VETLAAAGSTGAGKHTGIPLCFAGSSSRVRGQAARSCCCSPGRVGFQSRRPTPAAGLNEAVWKKPGLATGCGLSTVVFRTTRDRSDPRRAVSQAVCRGPIPRSGRRGPCVIFVTNFTDTPKRQAATRPSCCCAKARPLRPLSLPGCWLIVWHARSGPPGPARGCRRLS